MNDTEVILRYLYLGTDQPFYIRKNKPLDVNEGCRILAPVRTLAEATAHMDDPAALKAAEAVTLKEPPVDMIVRIMKSGTLVRNDECLFALAFLARTFTKPEEKHKVYEVVPTLIESSKDLFQFVHFYQVLAAKPAGKGFGNGMKVAIGKWYNKHSAEELANLLAMDRGWHDWCHKDILKMAHMNLEDEAKMQVLDAACGGKGKKRPTKSKTNGESKDDVAQVDSKALKIYNRMKAFKSVQTANEATGCIKTHKYSLQLVPSQLHRAPVVWESLFPHMSYRDIVQAALVLQDYKLLKETDTPLSEAYGKVLNRMTSVTESKVNSIFIYQVMRLFEERQRYLNAVKEAIHTTNNLALKNTKANPTVLKQFYGALNQSMLNYQRTGLNFLVTLDLRSKQSKKRVFGNRLMSCQAAYILLTLPMFKREPHLKVFSFTDQPTELVEVDLTREMDFFKGCDHIQNHANKKTKVSITQPIQHATKKQMKVDVFITIVDSLIRVNPKRESPVAALKSYNKNMNRNARYIVVSLSRHQQDLDHANMGSTKGVLELVGCSEETPKLIDAYVKHHFT
ncbi:RNA-binding protein RO60-like [Ochlerotatus camptorhynchus]|uniref:RNA-binding protein RO60-like n=1 Tax=Ochlerotatus camptorhynchus TaxID=644619 RepID=UPI0031D968CB